MCPKHNSRCDSLTSKFGNSVNTVKIDNNFASSNNEVVLPLIDIPNDGYYFVAVQLTITTSTNYTGYAELIIDLRGYGDTLYDRRPITSNRTTLWIVIPFLNEPGATYILSFIQTSGKSVLYDGNIFVSKVIPILD